MFKPRHTRGQARFKAVQRIHLRVGTETQSVYRHARGGWGHARAVVPLVDAGAKLIVTGGHHTAANDLPQKLIADNPFDGADARHP